VTLGKKHRATHFRKPVGALATNKFVVPVRALLLAALSVAASVWAIHRYYTRIPAPMLRPMSAGADGGGEVDVEVELTP
jgi:hypothetical protein